MASHPIIDEACETPCRSYHLTDTPISRKIIPSKRDPVVSASRLLSTVPGQGASLGGSGEMVYS